MKFEQALYEYLTDDGNIAALVSDRVYPMRLPEGAAMPAISWHRVSANRIYTYDLFADTDAWTAARIQFNCWSRVSAEEAIAVGEAVLLALSGYDGDMGGQYIGSSFAVGELDTYEPDTQFYRRIVDLQMSYEDDLADS